MLFDRASIERAIVSPWPPMDVVNLGILAAIMNVRLADLFSVSCRPCSDGMAAQAVLARITDRPAVPAWVDELVSPQTPACLREVEGIACTLKQASGALLISTAIPQARAMSLDTFQAATQQAYQAIYATLASSPTPHPWRFWQFVPDILRDEGDGLLRYMVFNAGRHQAMLTRHGVREFASAMVAASAVGSSGEDLVIHLLAGDTPGLAIENPRQVSAFHYSTHYGPLPPCFARATLIPQPGPTGLLFISGTASIVGEDSTHPQAFNAQCQEILANFRSVLSQARDRLSLPDAGRDILATLRHARVYLPDMARQQQVQSLLVSSCPNLTGVEYLPALVCRPELDVEIEALAWLAS